ncbi:MAG: hypothetical protein WBG01_18525 [Bacteroidota bacterium]|jgi:hypothetical protein
MKLLTFAAFFAMVTLPAILRSKTPDPAHVYEDPDDVLGRELWRD